MTMQHTLLDLDHVASCVLCFMRSHVEESRSRTRLSEPILVAIRHVFGRLELHDDNGKRIGDVARASGDQYDAAIWNKDGSFSHSYMLTIPRDVMENRSLSLFLRVDATGAASYVRTMPVYIMADSAGIARMKDGTKVSAWPNALSQPHWNARIASEDFPFGIDEDGWLVFLKQRGKGQMLLRANDKPPKGNVYDREGYCVWEPVKPV